MLTFREVKVVLLDEVTGKDHSLTCARLLGDRIDPSASTARQIYSDSFHQIAQRGEYHEFETTLGGLQCVVRINSPVHELEILMIFFHGLGANPVNCLHLATKYFQVHGKSSKCAFVFPRAPLKMDSKEFGADGLSVYGSYKWWDILNFSTDDTSRREASPGLFGWCKNKTESQSRECEKLPEELVVNELNQELIIGGSPVNFKSHKKESPEKGDLFRAEVSEEEASDVAAFDKLEERAVSFRPNVQKSNNKFGPGRLNWLRSLIEGFLQDCEVGFGLDRSRFVVAGFSQGGMLALDTMFHSQEPLLGIGVFSALPMCSEEWKEKMVSRKSRTLQKTFLFHSHGTSDRVVPYITGVWLRRFLQRLGFQNLYFRQFKGNHVIDESSCREFFDLIQIATRKLSKTAGTSNSPTTGRSTKSRGSQGSQGSPFGSGIPVVKCSMFDDCTYRHTSALARRCLPKLAKYVA